MSRFRLCFLGTPQFAEVHLQSLLLNPNYEVVGVVTQPDRPAGRKMQLTPSPVKILAQKHGLPVLTPEKLRHEPEAFAAVKSWNADAAVVVAFGQILSQEFLDSFKFGAVNVHGSLLPKWRGAAPIQRSLEAGDRVTGVSLQKMVKKLDAGPIIGEKKIELNDAINATELYERLAVLGCELLRDDLYKYLCGEIVPRPQDETQVTFAAKIEKEESLLDWNLPARSLHNKIRAFSMGPGTYVMFQGKRLKIHQTDVLQTNDPAVPPGCVSEISGERLSVQTTDGALLLREVQPESKPRMNIRDFLKVVAQSSLRKGDKFV